MKLAEMIGSADKILLTTRAMKSIALSLTTVPHQGRDTRALWGIPVTEMRDTDKSRAWFIKDGQIIGWYDFR